MLSLLLSTFTTGWKMIASRVRRMFQWMVSGPLSVVENSWSQRCPHQKQHNNQPQPMAAAEPAMAWEDADVSSNNSN